MSITDDLHKLAMAGLGAATVAAEKTQEAIEALAKRGEETLEQGKALNEQLHHDVQASVAPKAAPSPEMDAVLKALETLTPEQRATVAEKLQQLQSDQHTNG